MSERDYGAEAQQAAEEHLEACYEAEFEAECVGEEEVESPAVGPFCGCTTCMVREVLHAAWPILLLAARETRICALCNQPARGLASVWTPTEGEKWYCHGDDDAISCYEIHAIADAEPEPLW